LLKVKPAAFFFSFASIPALLIATSLTALSQAPLASESALSARLRQQLQTTFDVSHEWPAEVDLKWLNGGDSYTVVEPTADGKGSDIVAYETESGKRSVLVTATQLTPEGAKEPLEIREYSWSADKKKLLIFTNAKRVWRQFTRGDFWVLDTEGSTAAGKLTKLGGDAPESSLMFATFSPDSSRVAWVRANNLYVEELASQKITQLTTDGSADIINGTSDWVNEEELELRNCFRWSPDSQSIAYWQFDQSGEGEYTLINDTDQLYPVTKTYKYPLAGTTNASVRAGVVPAAGGPTRWIKLAGDPRNHYIAEMAWAGSSQSLLLEYLDRLQQTNQFILADAKTGETRVAGVDTDKAWVEVHGLGWVAKTDKNKDSGKDMLFISERDGWRHAWRMDLSSGNAKVVTNIDGDILMDLGTYGTGSEVTTDEQGGWYYFLASPGDAIREYLYRARLDGSGTPERLTPADEIGSHTYDISPNGRWAVHRYMTMDAPVRNEIVSLPDHKVVRSLVDYSKIAAKMAPLLGSKTEFFKVPIDNGVTLDGYMIKPPDFDPKKKYPVLVYVYGEPLDATVRDDSRGGRLFAGLFAREGYLVVSFDNQGTPALKGRAWRKCVYGAVGVLSSAQQVQAIQELAKERGYIDTARMAIWGWSGGGSNTLNVMFRYPGVFSTGIAVAPVPDESRYDTIYQERYMGLPTDNAKGYHDGSPINFADGLSGNLLMLHGSGDDNVHFQGMELLVNKLIEQGKTFDFMDYPNRTHGIYEGKGTTLHVYTLIARYLEEHVPPGGVAR
jgi:dipeptidyl-peptidase-4